MESNGKSVRLDGARVGYHTGSIVWGTAGTNGQHAYYQLLHQGTHIVPMDLIGFVNPTTEVGDHHDLLMANLFAQAEAFAFGRTRAQCDCRRACPPTRSTHGCSRATARHRCILADRLTPRTLGTLIALYEHKVFVQGVIWGIDSFDQWGVELGKDLAMHIAGELMAEPFGVAGGSRLCRRRCSSAGSWRGGSGRRTDPPAQGAVAGRIARASATIRRRACGRACSRASHSSPHHPTRTRTEIRHLG